MSSERIRNMRLTQKLLVAPFTVLLLLIIFSVVSYISVSKQQSALDDIYKNRLKRSQIVASAISDVTLIHAKVAKLYSSARELELMTKVMNKDNEAASDTPSVGSASANSTQQEERNQIVTSLQSLAASAEQAGKSGGATKEEKASFLRVKEDSDQYATTLQAFFEKLGAGNASDAAGELGRSEMASRALSQDYYDLFHLEQRLSDVKYGSAGTAYRIVLGVMALVLVVAVVLSVVVSMTMKSVILSPITRTVEVIEAVAAGDLTRRINVATRDEIGEMAGHLNRFVEKLHGAITQVSHSSNEVSSAANTLDGATEHMAAGVREAAAQIDAVAAASEEMSKTSSEIAQNCVAAVRSAEIAGGSANKGEAIISGAIEVMDRISNRVGELADIIRRLGARSDQIGEIVGLINDVADQTNLLALNAAIEAARAGEHGRGFAVVADEVRKLAERTANATLEITNTIHEMQVETKKAVSSMEEGVGEVRTGASEVVKSGEALKDITLHINKVTGEINQIAVASEEETATTNEIAATIQRISSLAQETAKKIQENSNASSQLANLSKELQTMVGWFRLSEE